MSKFSISKITSQGLSFRKFPCTDEPLNATALKRVLLWTESIFDALYRKKSFLKYFINRRAFQIVYRVEDLQQLYNIFLRQASFQWILAISSTIWWASKVLIWKDCSIKIFTLTEELFIAFCRQKIFWRSSVKEEIIIDFCERRSIWASYGSLQIRPWIDELLIFPMERKAFQQWSFYRSSVKRMDIFSKKILIVDRKPLQCHWWKNKLFKVFYDGKSFSMCFINVIP